MKKLLGLKKFSTFSTCSRFYVSEYRNNKTPEVRREMQQNEVEKRKAKGLQGKGSFQKRRKFVFSRDIAREFEFDMPMSIAEISVKLGIPLDDFVRGLKGEYQRDQMLNMDAVEELCLDLDVLAIRKKIPGIDVKPFSGVEDVNAPPRPAIVTIMGHVDHGKTTLMDKLRNANVAENEFGGITQHIGAFEVKIPDGQIITFIDTPGHAAFTKMRKAGAETTDIVVLVIAADDGIMAQTKEAIAQALSANTKIIVALNKIDKVKHQHSLIAIERDLLNYRIRTEKMGGSVPVIEISALHETNLDKLLEEIVLQGSVMEVRSKRDCPAECVVIENQRQSGVGLSTSGVVRRGVLTVGSWIVSGTTYGKVKSLANYLDEKISEAGPSKPCQIVGLKDEPVAGDYIIQVASEDEAIKICEYRKKVSESRNREFGMESPQKVLSETVKKYPVIIKCDVTGTMDAINLILTKFPRSEAVIEVFSLSVGQVTESDIKNAKTIGGNIVTMNVKTSAGITKQALNSKIAIHNFRIIYQLTDFFKSELSKLLPEDVRIEQLGSAEIKKVFEFTAKKDEKPQIVAGGYVTDGQISTRANVWKILRDGVPLVGKFKLTTLKMFKNEVESVGTNTEFGIIIEGYAPVVGDVIQPILETRSRKEIKLSD
jgi:translation initiation factor IF-2